MVFQQPFPEQEEPDSRAVRREKKRYKAQHGMRVNGASVKVLATIIPKVKRRKHKKGRRKR